MTNRCVTTALPVILAFFGMTETSLGAPVIDSIMPQSGVAGSRVTIVGRGFAVDNVVAFGSILIRHVGIASAIAIACTADPKCKPGIRQSLDFTVPLKIHSGSYRLSVRNSSGASNVTSFSVMVK